VDTAVANTAWGQFSSMTDTQGGYHYYYQKNGATVVDIDSTLQNIQINSGSLDSTHTNIALKITQTNLIAGWGIQMSTNLALVNAWQNLTNFTAITNTGIVTFTVPINLAAPMGFFRAIAGLNNTFTVTPPITSLGGVFYPSNTWNLAAITNVMPNFGVWTGNSNGCCLVTISLSNGVVRYLQSLH
jgi:hypothetical protein